MNVTVVFFARAREIVGKSQLKLSFDEDTTLFDAKQKILQLHPDLGDLFTHCTFAVDKEYSDDKTVLTEGCEVGCIPPVSGG